MTRYFITILPAFLLLSLIGYSHPVTGNDTTELTCMQKAQKLLDEALTFMQKNYYRKSQVDWEQMTSEARSRLKASGNCEDAYNTISWCFAQLNEQHSFLMPPARAARYTNDASLLSRTPNLSELVGEIKGEWLADSIGYLTIPWVSTTDSLICLRIADSIQAVIARLDSRNISRWIVDLRKNSGGNCWPMLAGIGPLLGEGVCGYFVSPTDRSSIAYRDGSVLQGPHVRCRVSGEGYQPRQRRKSIAVLTGRRTVSAGEIVALAFKGRAETYLLGEPTAGLTTANATYSLSDHSLLVLSICQEADHTGRICEGSIIPDKFVPSGGTSTEDPVRTAAVSWLQGR